MPKASNFENELNALRVLKGLRVDDVARRARIPKSTASQLLRNRLINPAKLARLRRVIETAPGPRMTVHP